MTVYHRCRSQCQHYNRPSPPPPPPLPLQGRDVYDRPSLPPLRLLPTALLAREFERSLASPKILRYSLITSKNMADSWEMRADPSDENPKKTKITKIQRRPKLRRSKEDQIYEDPKKTKITKIQRRPNLRRSKEDQNYEDPEKTKITKIQRRPKLRRSKEDQNYGDTKKTKFTKIQRRPKLLRYKEDQIYEDPKKTKITKIQRRPKLRRSKEDQNYEDQPKAKFQRPKRTTVFSLRSEEPPLTPALLSAGPQVNNHTLLEFTQSDEDVGSLRVTEAMLWVYVRRLPGARHHDPSESKTTLWVFRIPPEDTRENPLAELATSLRVTPTRDGWRRLNLTSLVQRWFARSGERLRLLVDCSSCGGELEAPLFTPRKHKGAHKPGSRRAEASHRPFLVVHTAPTPSRRLSRRALQCDKNTQLCCKQELFISFNELGWDDWIIAPRGYKANYCKGSCDSVYRTPDSFTNFHAHVLEELRRNRPAGALTQCCAPTKLSPMSLIYLDEYSNIIKRDVPRMVVEECGCA
ncbi:inhibin beta B chain-like [Penaeus japonicus]|uniref:inhibin beta B chain-like n=1 Tax=Penaeus japonicus TaxID=27405 RepID=UPI001C70F96F|nr:inhibin beta B chain-like [Penaeus japonicus]